MHDSPKRTPPASMLLVHGAGSGPWVYYGWLDEFPNTIVRTVDLHAGLNVADASMNDYADRIVAAGKTVMHPVALVGWSMGGLAAMLAAQRMDLHSLILLEPSAPSEIQAFRPDVELRAGAFDPENVYGPFPSGMPVRLESSFARAERKRGISVPSVRCPALVVFGDEFRSERGETIARFYGAEARYFPGLCHWDLVRDPRIRPAIGSFLQISHQNEPKIQTARLDLLPIRREHAPEMFSLLNDRSLYEFATDAPPTDVAALAARYEMWESRTSPDGSELWLNWIVRLRTNGSFIGHVQASVNVSHASVAWVVGSHCHKQGYATEAASAMLDWLAGIGIRETTAAINPANTGSVRVAERLGLRRTEELSGTEILWKREFRS